MLFQLFLALLQLLTTNISDAIADKIRNDKDAIYRYKHVLLLLLIYKAERKSSEKEWKIQKKYPLGC